MTTKVGRSKYSETMFTQEKLIMTRNNIGRFALVLLEDFVHIFSNSKPLGLCMDIEEHPLV